MENNPPETQNNLQKITAHPIPKMNHPRILKRSGVVLQGGVLTRLDKIWGVLWNNPEQQNSPKNKTKIDK